MPDQVLYALPGQCSAAAVYPYPTISGYCGAVSNVLVSPAPGTLLSVGEHTATCTVNFTNGSSDQTQFKVTVHPSFQPPDVIRYSYGAKCAGVTLVEAQPIQVFYPDAVAPTNCGSYSGFSYSIPSGSVFPLGTNVVTVMATDGQGHPVSEPFNVIVRPSYGVCVADTLTNAVVDCDGDGMPDWAEEIAGTGVCDSNSVFRLSPVTVTNGDVRVWFPAIGGNKYQLLCAPFSGGLALSNFLPVTGFYTDASPFLHLTNLVHTGGATNAQGRAYRVSITQ